MTADEDPSTPPTDLFRQVEAICAAHYVTIYTDTDIYCRTCGRLAPSIYRYHGEEMLWEAGLLRERPPVTYFDDHL